MFRNRPPHPNPTLPFLLPQEFWGKYKILSQAIHPFDNYVIWLGSLTLVNREPITLRNLLMRARLQDQKVGVT